MKKEYEQLQKKHDLPTLNNMDKDFQISTIEAKKFLLKEIAKKMNEKIESYANLLEQILNPESGLSSLHESSMFNDEEKKEVLKIYRKLLFNHRKYSYLDITYEEEKTVNYIKELYEEWQTLKISLKKILVKIQNSWNKDKKTKLELSYFG